MSLMVVGIVASTWASMLTGFSGDPTRDWRLNAFFEPSSSLKLGRSTCTHVLTPTFCTFLGQPRKRGWHGQHFVQPVPASHLSHTGFLCVQATDMFSNDVLRHCRVWELVKVSLCVNYAYSECSINVACI